MEEPHGSPEDAASRNVPVAPDPLLSKDHWLPAPPEVSMGGSSSTMRERELPSEVLKDVESLDATASPETEQSLNGMNSEASVPPEPLDTENRDDTELAEPHQTVTERGGGETPEQLPQRKRGRDDADGPETPPEQSRSSRQRTNPTGKPSSGMRFMDPILRPMSGRDIRRAVVAHEEFQRNRFKYLGGVSSSEIRTKRWREIAEELGVPLPPAAWFTTDKGDLSDDTGSDSGLRSAFSPRAEASEKDSAAELPAITNFSFTEPAESPNLKDINYKKPATLSAVDVPDLVHCSVAAEPGQSPADSTTGPDVNAGDVGRAVQKDAEGKEKSAVEVAAAATEGVGEVGRGEGAAVLGEPVRTGSKDCFQYPHPVATPLQTSSVEAHILMETGDNSVTESDGPMANEGEADRAPARMIDLEQAEPTLQAEVGPDAEQPGDDADEAARQARVEQRTLRIKKILESPTEISTLIRVLKLRGKHDRHHIVRAMVRAHPSYQQDRQRYLRGQKGLNTHGWLRIAREIGLDISRLEHPLNRPRHRKRPRQDADTGNQDSASEEAQEADQVKVSPREATGGSRRLVSAPPAASQVGGRAPTAQAGTGAAQPSAAVAKPVAVKKRGRPRKHPLPPPAVPSKPPAAPPPESIKVEPVADAPKLYEHVPIGKRGRRLLIESVLTHPQLDEMLAGQDTHVSRASNVHLYLIARRLGVAIDALLSRSVPSKQLTLLAEKAGFKVDHGPPKDRVHAQVDRKRSQLESGGAPQAAGSGVGGGITDKVKAKVGRPRKHRIVASDDDTDDFPPPTARPTSTSTSQPIDAPPLGVKAEHRTSPPQRAASNHSPSDVREAVPVRTVVMPPKKRRREDSISMSTTDAAREPPPAPARSLGLPTSRIDSSRGSQGGYLRPRKVPETYSSATDEDEADDKGRARPSEDMAPRVPAATAGAASQGALESGDLPKQSTLWARRFADTTAPVPPSPVPSTCTGSTPTSIVGGGSDWGDAPEPVPVAPPPVHLEPSVVGLPAAPRTCWTQCDVQWSDCSEDCGEHDAVALLQLLKSNRESDRDKDKDRPCDPESCHTSPTASVTGSLVLDRGQSLSRAVSPADHLLHIVPVGQAISEDATTMVFRDVGHFLEAAQCLHLLPVFEDNALDLASIRSKRFTEVFLMHALNIRAGDALRLMDTRDLMVV